jgi:hypothetical protein
VCSLLFKVLAAVYCNIDKESNSEVVLLDTAMQFPFLYSYERGVCSEILEAKSVGTVP